MKRLLSLSLLTACVVAAPAFAARCPTTYVPGAADVCDLHNATDLVLQRGGTIHQRIALPLNTTIDDAALPMYAVEAKTWLFEGAPTTVRVALTLTDDRGANTVALGSTSAMVQPGHDRISLAVQGGRAAQPAYLNVLIEADAEGGAAPIDIKELGVIQSFDGDVEAVAR
jgi:hypothetical protein